MPLLLVATLLAVSASVASAECAWVLWHHHTSTLPSSSWSIEGGYKTTAECTTEQTRWWDATIKDLSNRAKYSKITKVEGQRPESIDVTVTRDSVAEVVNHDYLRQVLCLPDTIDPREAKGAGSGAQRNR
jgi:hypothetical protein